mgnify:CR=1 FL=1
MKKFRKWIPLFLLLGLFPAQLTGCDLGVGRASYEIIYPSGLSRGPYDWNDIVPAEGVPYQLTSGKSENFDKTRTYDLRVLDENGEVLYEYPELGHSVVCGEAGGQENTVWVSCELWNTPHHHGYRDGCLEESTLLLLDMETGEILFQAEAGENECYLTSRQSRCYFYKPGEPERKKLFGLLKTPAQNAELYYRDTEDWSERHTVYTFDYVDKPDMGGSGVEDRVKFYLSENQIRAAWTSYESVEDGKWEYLEKRIYEISLETG